MEGKGQSREKGNGTNLPKSIQWGRRAKEKQMFLRKGTLRLKKWSQFSVNVVVGVLHVVIGRRVEMILQNIQFFRTN
jgi:hypothetical protein